MATVLVFGGGGWLGRVLVPLLSETHDVVAPASTDVNVADRAAVQGAVAAASPAAVVNLAACNPGRGSVERMSVVNALGARHVAEAARGVRLVHVSSDLVLDGLEPPYADDVAAGPGNHYGRTKASGEAAVLQTHDDAVAVRTSLVFDPAEIDRGTAGFARRLAGGEPCTLFTDEIRCPVARRTLAAALAELVASDFTGRLNVAGTEALSRHAYGLAMLRHFGVAGLDAVRTASAADLDPPRPLDLTLDTSLAARVLRTPLRSVGDELRG